MDSSLPGVVFHSLALSSVLELGVASGQRCPTRGKHRSLPLTPHSLHVGQGELYEHPPCGQCWREMKDESTSLQCRKAVGRHTDRNTGEESKGRGR